MFESTLVRKVSPIENRRAEHRFQSLAEDLTRLKLPAPAEALVAADTAIYNAQKKAGDA
jgi:hypothetical protein